MFAVVEALIVIYMNIVCESHVVLFSCVVSNYLMNRNFQMNIFRQVYVQYSTYMVDQKNVNTSVSQQRFSKMFVNNGQW